MNRDKKRESIIDAYVQTGSVPATATILGLTQTVVRSTINTDAGARLVARSVKQLLLNSAPVAVSVLHDILDNSNISPSVRVDAAKALLDRAGFGPVRHVVEHNDSKTLSEMSIDELKGLLDRTESQLASLATPVSGTVSDPEPD